jgi:hypothetical protein
MENPFKYGIAVTGDDFVDRAKELEELKNEALAGKSVVLYSPRRLGKTSLLLELLRRLKRDVIPIYVKLYGIGSRKAFAGEIAERIIATAYTRLEKAREAVYEFLKELRPNLVLTPKGEIRIEVTTQISSRSLEEILDLPERVAKKRKKRILVAFDEFQEIGLLDGVEIEKMMKARFEHHRKVTYIFAGSKRHLLHQIFADEGRPLFKFARPMELGNIPRKDFAGFIAHKFKEGGGRIGAKVVGDILELTDGHPYFTQQLCHELWFITRDVKDRKPVEKAIDNILAHYGVEYERTWDGLPGAQRNLLLGLAKEPDLSPYSSDFITRYRVKTSAHVQRGLKSLEAKGLIEDIRILDIFFREWLKRRIR